MGLEDAPPGAHRCKATALAVCWGLSLILGIWWTVVGAARSALVDSVDPSADFAPYAPGCTVNATALQPHSDVSSGERSCADFYVFGVRFRESAQGAWPSREWRAGVRDASTICSDTSLEPLPPKYNVSERVPCWVPASPLSEEVRSLYQCSASPANPDCYKLFDPAADLSSPDGEPEGLFDDPGQTLRPLVSGILLLCWFFCGCPLLVLLVLKPSGVGYGAWVCGCKACAPQPER